MIENFLRVFLAFPCTNRIRTQHTRFYRYLFHAMFHATVNYLITFVKNVHSFSCQSLVASGEKMGFQITLFLTLAIYTSQFQEELPVWQKQTNTPLLTYTGSGFI